VRSSGTPGSPTAPSGIQLSTTAGRWRAAISLTLACASILFALSALPALIWAPYVVYALASIAFLFGVIAMRKDVGKVKAVAGWSISLSVLTALFEAARLLFHF
jgi:hypothetical protein